MCRKWLPGLAMYVKFRVIYDMISTKGEETCWKANRYFSEKNSLRRPNNQALAYSYIQFCCPFGPFCWYSVVLNSCIQRNHENVAKLPKYAWKQDRLMILIKKFGINTKIKLFLFLQSTWFIIYNSFTLVMGSGTKKWSFYRIW